MFAQFNYSICYISGVSGNNQLHFSAHFLVWINTPHSFKKMMHNAAVMNCMSQSCRFDVISEISVCYG